MVKSTNDNQIIPFVLKLEVEKWKNFDLKEDNLAKVLFCEKKLNINFKKLVSNLKNNLIWNLM